VSEAVARCDRAKGSRGGHFPTTIDKSDEYSKFNFVVRKGLGRDGEMQIPAASAVPGHLKAIIEEMK
jgi:hypothetical protein